MAPTITRVAINTEGGDVPGLNAVIHGAVYASLGLGWQIVSILRQSRRLYGCWPLKGA